MECVYLCLDLDEESGIFSRPEAGARRPHAFRRQYPERGHKTLVPAAPSRNPELLAGARSRRASSLMALCRHPPLRRERYRCDPAITVKVEGNRGRCRRKELPPSASMTGLRAPLHVSIDTGGIPAPAPAVTRLVVDEFSRDLA